MGGGGAEIEKLMLKFIWKCKGSRRAKNKFEKKKERKE